MMFSVGLCLFAYASGQVSPRLHDLATLFVHHLFQSKMTSAVTTALTGLSALGITGATAWFILEFHSIDELWLMAKTFKESLSSRWSNMTATFRDKKDAIQLKLEERTPRIVSAYRTFKESFSVPVSYIRSGFLTAEVTISSFFVWLSSVGTWTKALADRAMKKLKTVPRPISRHNSAAMDAILGGADQEGNSQLAASDLEKGNGLSSVEEGGEEKPAPLLSFNSAVKSAVLMKRWRSTVARKTSVQESPIDGLIGAFKTIKPKYIEDISQSVDCLSFSPDGKFLALCK